MVHVVAKVGFGKGNNDLYDRARPSYQAFALSHIKRAAKVNFPVNIVEIGAGTGIFTRALLANPEWASSIKELKAIEPSEGMREVFSKLVDDTRVTLSDGLFDDTGVENGWADLVVVAQAYHWCPDYDKACAEFARILKPGGIVAFIWNSEDRESARWVAQLRDRIELHEEGTPQFRHDFWRKTFDTLSYLHSFKPHEEKVWSYQLPANSEIVTDRACSKSYIAIQKDDVKAKVVNDIRQILDKGEDKVWIDEAQGIFEYPYKTILVVAERK